MKEGRLKILEMLQEGKLSVDEAMELLQQFPENDMKQENEGTFAKIGNDIKNAVSDVWDVVEDIDFSDFGEDISGFFGGWGRHKSETTYMSDPVASIAAIKILGKNAPVEIEAYDGSCLKIVAKYTSKRDGMPIYVNHENGTYELLYDYNSVRFMGVKCYVPRGAAVETIYAETKNAKIEVDNLKQIDQINLLTKNAKIEIEGVDCPRITAKTRNAQIEAARVNAEILDFSTSNAKIEVESVVARAAHLTTTNAKISLKYADIEQMHLKTTNGNIKFANIFGNMAVAAAPVVFDPQRPPSHAAAPPYGERIIDATTTNAGVSLEIPRDIAVKLQASTTNARLECSLQNLLVNEMSKNYINGKTNNYDEAEKRLKLNINTSNGNIKIREAY